MASQTETSPASETPNAGLQVIVLGPTGGPCEDSVTGILIRSTSTNWGPGSIIAVDAGTLLCGLKNVLEANDDNGPFADMVLPYKTAKANAAHILRETVGPVLVTHAHLDHISGFVLNTPILEASNGPKCLTALPSVIAAFKEHIFNEVLWPNLSDEDGGAGLITFQRLVEGGNPHMGRGEEKGYVRACEGLMTRCFAVSHGRCKRGYQPPAGTSTPDINPRRLSQPASTDMSLLQLDDTTPSLSPAAGASQPQSQRELYSTVESSAFFIRDHASGTEIIVFGDIEPDTVSLLPRNRRVWEKAAPKVVSNTLRAIFIECSYDDSVADEYLYGHLCPRHLINELKVLAQLVIKLRREEGSAQSTSLTKGTSKGKSVTFSEPDENDDVGEDNDIMWSEDEQPLAGLTVFLIHIKEDMTEDEPVTERILTEVKELAEQANLGCAVRIPSRGENIYI